MRIVHVTNYYMPELGYQEGYLAMWHARFGHEVHVVTSNRLYPLASGYEIFESVLGKRIVDPSVVEDTHGVRVHRLSAVLERRMQIWLRGLPRIVTALEPDIVIAHGFSRFETIRLSRLRRRGKIKRLVVDDHTFESAYIPTRGRRLFYATLKALWPRVGIFDDIVAVTRETRAFLVSHFGIPVAKIRVIPLGTDTDLFVSDNDARRRVRHDFGLTDSEVLLVYAGKLTADKGVHILLDSALDVIEKLPITVLLIGSGLETPYGRELVQRVHDANATDQIRFHTHVPHTELAALFAAADIAVWPWQETMTALQAASAGVPIILRDSEVGREWTEAGNGLTWSTSAELVEAITQLASDSGSRIEMGRRGAAFVRERFDWRLAAEAFLEPSHTQRSSA